MIVTAWNNGQHHATGAGYGVKINAVTAIGISATSGDRSYLNWKARISLLRSILISRPFGMKYASELIKKEVGLWLLLNGLAPWPKYHPPKLCLEPIGERRFRLYRPIQI